MRSLSLLLLLFSLAAGQPMDKLTIVCYDSSNADEFRIDVNGESFYFYLPRFDILTDSDYIGPDGHRGTPSMVFYDTTTTPPTLIEPDSVAISVFDKLDFEITEIGGAKPQLNVEYLTTVYTVQGTRTLNMIHQDTIIYYAGDVDGDGDCDNFDVMDFQLNWLKTRDDNFFFWNDRPDFNKDDRVDALDLDILLRAYMINHSRSHFDNMMNGFYMRNGLKGRIQNE